MLSFCDFTVRLTEKKDQASIIDVIRVTTRRDTKAASQTFDRLRKLNPEIDTQIQMYKFPNSVKLSPVASAPVIVEILWALPGKGAKEIRVKSARNICRLLGADESLIKDIELRNLSTSADEKNFFLSHIKRSHVDSTYEEDEIILKKRKLEVKNLELDIELKRQTVIRQSIELFKETSALDIFMNDAHMKALGRDLIIQSYMVSAGSDEKKDTPFPYCSDFSDILQQMGTRPTPKMLSSMGKFVAKEYRAAFNEEPPTIPKYVAGANRLVKTYPIKHDHWLRTKISDFLKNYH